jgi:hypothetical protein
VEAGQILRPIQVAVVRSVVTSGGLDSGLFVLSDRVRDLDLQFGFAEKRILAAGLGQRGSFRLLDLVLVSLVGVVEERTIAGFAAARVIAEVCIAIRDGLGADVAGSMLDST